MLYRNSLHVCPAACAHIRCHVTDADLSDTGPVISLAPIFVHDLRQTLFILYEIQAVIWHWLMWWSRPLYLVDGWSRCLMMTSSNGNIPRITGPLWGESIGHRWIPLTKASDSELWCWKWNRHIIGHCQVAVKIHDLSKPGHFKHVTFSADIDKTPTNFFMSQFKSYV